MNILTSFLSSIRWQDAVDITLNSYILFRLYILFKGTNVLRVITGIAILWFFQRIAFALGLIVTSWAMQGIAAVAAIIIIIVFRNEIRNVLQAKNLKAILWGFHYKTADTPIEILVESIFELARRGSGALIVFPGKEDLKDIVRGGISWHGRISKEMITSIFYHDNPVHDGAAIVQGNNITEVRGILPLSHRENLPSFYGTRHRAAVGLAEVTDALTAVVSEERGDVAVAQNSEIRNIRSKAELTELLQEHIGISAKKTNYPRKERLEIGAAAVVSFLFITGVWFSFSQGLDTLITLEIPIEYMNRDPGMEIMNTSVDTVSLQLSGSGALVKSIRPEQVQIRLDLGKAVVGHNSFTITHEDIILPPGVFLKKIQPPVIEATLDITVKKKLPLQVDWVGKLPDRLMLTNVQIDPEKVDVTGGKLILDKISSIYTEKVPLDNIDKSGEMSVALALNPASLKIAPGSKVKVTIKYVVEKKA